MRLRRSLAGVAAIAAGAAVWVAGQALNSGGGGPGGATTFVSTFNSRYGAVAPQSGDYSFSMLSGSATASQLPNLNLLNGTLNWAQIAQNGATMGVVPCWNGGWTICTLSQLAGSLNLSQLAQNGATTGNAPIWGGASWAPGTPSGGGSGGAVASVFGRTGSVVAQTGDYSYSQIGGTPVFVDQITPAGTVDGSNNVFTLPSAPNPPASLEVWVNGLLMCDSTTSTCPGGSDYTISGSTIQFAAAATPQPGDNFLASYRR